MKEKMNSKTEVMKALGMPSDFSNAPENKMFKTSILLSEGYNYSIYLKALKKILLQFENEPESEEQKIAIAIIKTNIAEVESKLEGVAEQLKEGKTVKKLIECDDFNIEFEYEEDSHAFIKFKAYEMFTYTEGDIKKKEYHIKDYDSPMDTTLNIEEADIYFQGDIKFDGCINIDFCNSTMYHFCEVEDAQIINNIIKEVFKFNESLNGKC